MYIIVHIVCGMIDLHLINKSTVCVESNTDWSSIKPESDDITSFFVWIDELESDDIVSIDIS